MQVYHLQQPYLFATILYFKVYILLWMHVYHLSVCEFFMLKYVYSALNVSVPFTET